MTPVLARCGTELSETGDRGRGAEDGEWGSSWVGGTYKVYHREPGHLDSDVGFNPFALVTTSYYLLKPH